MTKFEEIWNEAREKAGLSFSRPGTLSWELALYRELKEKIEPLIQQQALPVVPECVAEWIEHCKGMGYGLIAALTFKLSSTMHEELSAKILKWLGNERNDETFALAFITDKYQVEKPQQKRYEVKILSGESMHFNPIGNPKNIKDYRFSFGNYAGWKTQFTKSELAEIKDGMFYKILNQKSFTAPTAVSEDWIWSDELQAYEWKNPFIELVPVEDEE